MKSAHSFESGNPAQFRRCCIGQLGPRFRKDEREVGANQAECIPLKRAARAAKPTAVCSPVPRGIAKFNNAGSLSATIVVRTRNERSKVMRRCPA